MSSIEASRAGSPRRLLLVLLLLGMGCDAPAPDEGLRDGELMFDVDEEEVVRIHDAYVAEDDVALTRARLTAPFDCASFGDFCDQVGREAAIEITGMQVDFAREGATLEEMNAQTAAWISEAMDQHEPEPAEASLLAVTDTQGDFRLAVRNGITVPMVGDREAWTQSSFHHRDGQGDWWQVQAESLCVNAGWNTTVFLDAGVPETTERHNPLNTCRFGAGNSTVVTFHSRVSSPDSSLYTLTADGCGSANHEGTHFEVCADSRVETF